MARVRHKIALAAGLMTAALTARGGEPGGEVAPIRPVDAAYTIEIGNATIADTYLSPLTYSGLAVGLDYTRMQAARFAPEQWVMILNVRGDLDRALSDVGALQWRLDLGASWGLLRRWHIGERWQVGVGPRLAVSGGALYNARNSNNPASAKCAVTADATGYGVCNMRFGRMPVTFLGMLDAAIFGAFFSPEYDESYYEIYLGNHKNLVHFAWPGNRLSVSALLCADMHFGTTTLRVGYRMQLMTSGVGDITTNVFSNAFVIGLAGEWMGLSQRRGLNPDARIIKAIY